MKEGVNTIQKRAVSYILESFEKTINPICALDMGLGKTRVACCIIQNIITTYDEYKILIVIKASNYKDPWIKELLFTHCISKSRNKGNDPSVREFKNCIYMQGKDRFDYFRGNSEVYKMPSNNIYIVSYDTLRIDIEKNRYDNSLDYDLIVFDELQLIMNTKKETKKLLALSKIKADKKLALSGTPGQNTSLENGLMYIFLNDQTQLERYLSLPDVMRDITEDYTDENNEKEDLLKIKAEKDNILSKGKEDCIKNNALFYYSAEKPHFNKTAVILSLPVDTEHYILAQEHYGESGQKNLQKKLMYLSSPSSVYYYNYKNVSHPSCTKERAVEIILKHMGNGEKAVVFSRFKYVIYSYYDLCQRTGFPAVIITGKDKGRVLQDKLQLFKNSQHFKVLITTLQKSSEGFNFDFANHVIILEFWWNPRKIIQAMSRIDRISQSQDIYTYILCYNETKKKENEEGEIIEEKRIVKEEFMILDTMKKKVIDTNSFIADIYNENQIYYPDPLTLRELPETVEFDNVNTVEKELDEFIRQYHIKTDISKQGIREPYKLSINQTSYSINSEIKNYRNVSDILLRFPWRLWNQDIQEYLNNYYQLLNRNKGIEIKNGINEWARNILSKNTLFDSFYPFLFIKYITFTAYINGIQTRLQTLFALGKRENGLYHVLSPQYFPFRTAYDFFEFIFNCKITNISNIIKDNNFKISNELLSKLFFRPKTILSLTSIIEETVSYVHSKFNRGLSNLEASNIEALFSQLTQEDALKLVGRWISEVNNPDIIMYKYIQSNLKYTTPLFLYPLNIRSIIGTTNIIDILCLVINKLLENENFHNINYAKEYIAIAANGALEYGSDLIPNWEILTKPVHSR